jgi:hypothetical protein
MLTRIASHADILDSAEPSVRHQLIQTLCQPFFEEVVKSLCGEISSAGPGVAGATWQKTMDGPLKNARTTLCLKEGSGKQEEDSNDADTDSDFAALLSLGRTTLNLGKSLGLLEEDSTTLSLGQSLASLEEDSTDADSDSAFAALLSSEGEDCEGEQRLEWASYSSQFSGDADLEPPREDEKSQMVCRHWKTKGWCRYESQCKFLHPEYKRGICAKCPSENGDVTMPSRCTRRRGGKNKRNVVSLDSRLFFANSYNMCQSFALCQGV